jgi:tetratricopeptide (TPR) repeat protein
MRETYRKAREAYERFSPKDTQAAIAMLEPIVAQDDEGFVQALLANALLSVWASSGTRDVALLARAEDLAVRALDRDPAPALAYQAITRMRTESGDLAAAIQAAREASARAPMLADPHVSLALLLLESGRTADALRHLERAAQLTPRSALVYAVKGAALMLEADLGPAREAFELARRFGGPFMPIFVEMRAAFLWNDRDYARDIAERIAGSPPQLTFHTVLPCVRALANGGDFPARVAQDTLAAIVGPTVGPRRATEVRRSLVDMLAWGRHDAEALALLEALVGSAPFIDVAWLDRAPTLAPYRADPIFARVRAATADRAAALWR